MEHTGWAESDKPSIFLKKEIVEVIKEIEETSGNLLGNTTLDYPPDRHVAVLWVDEQNILDAMLMFLTGKADTSEYHLRLTQDSIPNDVKVLRTTHSWDRRAIGFLLEHRSFAIVPDGCPAPDITYNRQMWEFITKSKQEFTYPDGWLKHDLVIDDKGLVEVKFTRQDHTVFFSKEDK